MQWSWCDRFTLQLEEIPGNEKSNDNINLILKIFLGHGGHHGGYGGGGYGHHGGGHGHHGGGYGHHGGGQGHHGGGYGHHGGGGYGHYGGYGGYWLNALWSTQSLKSLLSKPTLLCYYFIFVFVDYKFLFDKLFIAFLNMEVFLQILFCASYEKS